MENKIARLIELVHRIPEACLDEAIEFMSAKIEENDDDKPSPSCPHCKGDNVSKNGRKDGRQRYRCNSCRKTFGDFTNTAISHSHYGEAVWKQVIRDAISGESLDATAVSIGVSHSTVFNMRHKILLALEAHEVQNPTVLDGVCELDDTYVLESYKGKKLPDGFWRKPRKHGAKAQKRGVSNEYVSICTGVQRDGAAYGSTVTRATPSKEDVIAVFEGRIGSEALILCDGAASYIALGEKCESPVKNVCEDGNTKGGKGFYNTNTANSFHSFIKSRYNQYRGVATKFLNRYNALFSKTFRNDSNLVDELYGFLTDNDTSNHRTVHDVKNLDLLGI